MATCAICLENISIDRVVGKLRCHANHFHACCIVDWLSFGKRECPLCRDAMDCKYLLTEIREQSRNLTQDHVDGAVEVMALMVMDDVHDNRDDVASDGAITAVESSSEEDEAEVPDHAVSNMRYRVMMAHRIPLPVD